MAVNFGPGSHHFSAYYNGRRYVVDDAGKEHFFVVYVYTETVVQGKTFREWEQINWHSDFHALCKMWRFNYSTAMSLQEFLDGVKL